MDARDKRGHDESGIVRLGIIRENRPDGGLFIVGEFVSHDSKLGIASLNHANPDAFNTEPIFRDYPLSGHAADNAISTRMTHTGCRAFKTFALQSTLFDHLICEGKNLRRNLDPKRLGGLKIDDELELGRQQNRQVGGLLALEHASGVETDLAIGIA
jgi:hypothetical protein